MSLFSFLTLLSRPYTLLLPIDIAIFKILVIKSTKIGVAEISGGYNPFFYFDVRVKSHVIMIKTYEKNAEYGNALQRGVRTSWGEGGQRLRKDLSFMNGPCHTA